MPLSQYLYLEQYKIISVFPAAPMTKIYYTSVLIPMGTHISIHLITHFSKK